MPVVVVQVDMLAVEAVVEAWAALVAPVVANAVLAVADLHTVEAAELVYLAKEQMV
jgi:hypothetical protein